MTERKKQTKAEQREAMVTKLIAIGKAMFAELGYAHTATEEIVKRAEVTRGALYHHFDGKEGLFKAVVDELQADLSERIMTASRAAPDPWSRFVAGMRAYLTAALDPHIQRILLLDAPAVFGWEAWRQADAEHGTRKIKNTLLYLIDKGIIQPQPVDALAHLLIGAINEGALWIAQSEDKAQALEDANLALETLLNSIKQ